MTMFFNTANSAKISVASGMTVPTTFTATGWAEHLFVVRMLANLPVGSELWDEAKELGLFRKYGIVFKEEITDGN